MENKHNKKRSTNGVMISHYIYTFIIISILISLLEKIFLLPLADVFSGVSLKDSNMSLILLFGLAAISTFLKVFITTKIFCYNYQLEKKQIKPVMKNISLFYLIYSLVTVLIASRLSLNTAVLINFAINFLILSITLSFTEGAILADKYEGDVITTTEGAPNGSIGYIFIIICLLAANFFFNTQETKEIEKPRQDEIYQQINTPIQTESPKQTATPSKEKKEKQDSYNTLTCVSSEEARENYIYSTKEIINFKNNYFYDYEFIETKKYNNETDFINATSNITPSINTLPNKATLTVNTYHGKKYNSTTEKEALFEKKTLKEIKNSMQQIPNVSCTVE